MILDIQEVNISDVLCLRLANVSIVFEMLKHPKEV